MAIKAYTGIMGSGKTYEVASVVIYGALASGRRVVSNIAGLNYEVYRALLIEDGIPPERIGEIVAVSHDAVRDPMFWRTDEDEKTGAVTVIQPGDLVVLDEIWRFWDGFAPRDTDEKRTPRPGRVLNFMRMHRQMPHPVTGVTCDLAIICQDIADVHRTVKGVIEETYVMTKLTAVGAHGSYRVDIFAKSRITRKPLRSLPPRTYKERFFPCYKSHSQQKEGGAAGQEVNIDKRGNILGGWYFKILLPLSIPVFIVAIWSVWSFLHPKEVKKPESVAAKSETEQKGAAQVRPEIAQEWRVSGWYDVGGIQRVVMTDGESTRFIVSPEALKVTAVSVEVKLPEGGFATSWTGGRKSSGVIPKAGKDD